MLTGTSTACLELDSPERPLSLERLAALDAKVRLEFLHGEGSVPPSRVVWPTVRVEPYTHREQGKRFSGWLVRAQVYQ